MKKQPESFTLVRYQDSPFGCSIEGNALALQVSSVGGDALVAYINQLIEERAELLDALIKLYAVSRVDNSATYSAVTNAAAIIGKTTD